MLIVLRRKTGSPSIVNVMVLNQNVAAFSGGPIRALMLLEQNVSSPCSWFKRGKGPVRKDSRYHKTISAILRALLSFWGALGPCCEPGCPDDSCELEHLEPVQAVVHMDSFFLWWGSGGPSSGYLCAGDIKTLMKTIQKHQLTFHNQLHLPWSAPLNQ